MVRPGLIKDLVEGVGSAGKTVGGAVSRSKVGRAGGWVGRKAVKPAGSLMGSSSPRLHTGLAAGAVGFGAITGVAGGVKGTINDMGQSSGMTNDTMNDIAVRSAFGGSKLDRTLQDSTEGLTNALSGGRSTYMKANRKRY